MPQLSYFDEFEAARNRTLRFGLACAPISKVNSRFLTAERQAQFPCVIRDAVGELEPEDLVAQCLSLHYRLMQPLEVFFGVKIYFTIGYVATAEDDRFYQSEDELRQLMINGLNGSAAKLHAWLTLPSMEIIDMTLATSLAVANDWPEKHYGRIVANFADDLTKGMRYHPMLLGLDYLHKIGALRFVPDSMSSA